MSERFIDIELPRIAYPLVINTIGKCIVTGHTITANCHGRECGKSVRLNLISLARRLGIDHSCMAQDLIPHLFCADCRSAGRVTTFSISISPTYDPHSPWPRALKRKKPAPPLGSAGAFFADNARKSAGRLDRPEPPRHGFEHEIAYPHRRRADQKRCGEDRLYRLARQGPADALDVVHDRECEVRRRESAAERRQDQFAETELLARECAQGPSPAAGYQHGRVDADSLEKFGDGHLRSLPDRYPMNRPSVRPRPNTTGAARGSISTVGCISAALP